MNSNKVVVFDLDETLGFFLELGMFWDAVTTYIGQNNIRINPQQLFGQVLDIFPEFLRPNIFTLLKYLKRKKQYGVCKGVMIYTNNQGPKEWGQYIKNYLNEKIEYTLFDQIIGAFKVTGKTIEVCRTTNDKTRDDFMRCTKLPENTEICFLDDTYHPDMVADNIYYIKLNPYTHHISFSVMIQRFINSNIIETPHFKEFAESYLKKYNYSYTYIEKSKADYEMDKIVSKKTMILLQEFFKQVAKTKTRRVKHKVSKRNRTMKYGIL